jgi:hypothetical protein
MFKIIQRKYNARWIQNPLLNKIRLSSSKPKQEEKQEEESEYDVFSQLKKQQNQNAEELDAKEKERIRRHQESAEKEIQDKQAKSFGTGSILALISGVAAYAYMGKSEKSHYKEWLRKMRNQTRAKMQLLHIIVEF